MATLRPAARQTPLLHVQHGAVAAYGQKCNPCAIKQHVEYVSGCPNDRRGIVARHITGRPVHDEAPPFTRRAGAGRGWRLLLGLEGRPPQRTWKGIRSWLGIGKARTPEYVGLVTSLDVWIPVDGHVYVGPRGDGSRHPRTPLAPPPSGPASGLLCPLAVLLGCHPSWPGTPGRRLSAPPGPPLCCP